MSKNHPTFLMVKPFVFTLLLLMPLGIFAKGIDSAFLSRFTYHFQFTSVSQYHPPFGAQYNGKNSLITHDNIQTTVTSTLMLGMRLWKGGEVYFDPEVSGGSGLSSTLGVAGFPNGEAFRVGDPKPAIFVARGYLKQTFAFTHDREWIEDDENQVATTYPLHSLTLNIGKFSIADFFDENSYSHDARKQFLNWGLMNNGAWDYPANTRGYTFGAVLEYRYFNWSVRASMALMPTVANGNDLDWRIDRSNSEAVELERRYDIFGRKGVIRALGYFTTAHMGNYNQAVKLDSVDVTATRQFGRTKAGFGINWEQEALPYLDFFARVGWNDGHNETWAFAEIDQTFSFGTYLSGHLWHREGDGAGLALVVNGLSPDHRNYLAAGGYGFMIGDGKLNYGNEFVMELYYSIRPFKKWLWITPDYQFILNPGYNKDRGPAHVFGLRVHVGI